MSNLAWVRRVVQFLRSQREEYHDMMPLMAKTDAYRLARAKFLQGQTDRKNADWQGVHDLLEMALAVARQVHD